MFRIGLPDEVWVTKAILLGARMKEFQINTRDGWIARTSFPPTLKPGEKAVTGVLGFTAAECAYRWIKHEHPEVVYAELKHASRIL